MKISVKHMLMSLSLALSSYAFVQGASAADSAIQGKADAGAKKIAICSACHGADGNSPAPSFPKLAGLGERYILKQLQDIQAWDKADAAAKAVTGRAVVEMTGQLASLNERDLADIAAYYASQSLQLAGSKTLEVKVNAGIMVDSLKLGEALYRGGDRETNIPACTGCHSPTGAGNSPAGYPRLSGQYAEYVEKQLRAFRSGDRTNDGEQMIMRLVAKNMNDAQIKSVSNYIAGLH